MVGIAQLVSAPDCGSGGPGFESLYPPYGVLAQSVEHLTFNQVVRGSNPRCLMEEWKILHRVKPNTKDE